MKSVRFLFLLLPVSLLAADPVSEMAEFSVFGKVDLAGLAKGDIKTAAGAPMNTARYLSVQSCFVIPRTPGQVIAAMKEFDPTAHRELKVYLHSDLPASPSASNFAKLNNPPGNSAVKSLIKFGAAAMHIEDQVGAKRCGQFLHLGSVAADDLDQLHAIPSPDFYAFDAGGRFTRDALLDLIKAAHAAGKVYVWTVTEPEVHISGDIGWITYVNRGSIKDASGTKDMTWLESAVLQKEQGIWRICFFHSTRAPEKN